MSARRKARPQFEIPTPKRTAVEAPPAAVQAFVDQGEPPPAPSSLPAPQAEEVETVTHRKPRSTPRRKSERGERLVVYLRPEVEMKARLMATKGRRSLSDVVEAALIEYTRDQGDE